MGLYALSKSYGVKWKLREWMLTLSLVFADAFSAYSHTGRVGNHFLTVLWDAAVPCRCGGDDHSGGRRVRSQRLRLTRRHRLERAEGGEGLGGGRECCGQVGSGVRLRYSPWGRREVFSNNRSGAGCNLRRWGCWWHVVSWCCCKDRVKEKLLTRNWNIVNMLKPLKTWIQNQKYFSITWRGWVGD